MKRLNCLRATLRLLLGLLIPEFAAAGLAQASAAPLFPPLNTLANFAPSDSGAFELSALTEGSDGNFYGVSAFGGAGGYGYIYKVIRRTGRIIHLHDFSYADGATPRGKLVQGTDGDFYGTTEAGGANMSDYCYAGQLYQRGGCGVAFKISPGGSFTKLHDFYTAADNYLADPSTGMIQASDGNFYGIAMVDFPRVSAAVFRMTADGTTTPLYQIPSNVLSYTGLIQGADGYLYGTTIGDGAAYGSGMFFRISLAGAFQSLHIFSGSDGDLPSGTLMQGRDGNFYGTTQYGGITTGHCIYGGCGIVYKMTTDGSETVLYRFTGSALDGEWPQHSGLVQTRDGSLYGTTGGNPYGDVGATYCYIGKVASAGCGTIYRITPAGSFQQLHSLSYGDSALGIWPLASMILASDGNLYGPTIAGGGWGTGTIYRLQLNPLTPVVAITGTSPASGPPGTSVTINGIGFTGTSQVTFPTGAATPINFTVISDSQISIVVPSNGVTGAIGVTAPRGTTFSPTLFTVTTSSGMPAAPAAGVGLRATESDKPLTLEFP
jgi:uncharacterized repeat protein (TIGR03803 family)